MLGFARRQGFQNHSKLYLSRFYCLSFPLFNETIRAASLSRAFSFSERYRAGPVAKHQTEWRGISQIRHTGLIFFLDDHAPKLGQPMRMYRVNLKSVVIAFVGWAAVSFCQ